MAFQEEVLALCKRIPKGRVSTYKDIALALNTKAYRAVGRVLHNNKTPIAIPCHRVVNCDGRVGGYSSGIYKKISLLNRESIKIKEGKISGFAKKRFSF